MLRSLALIAALLVAGLSAVGCGVPQPRGGGMLERRVEPATQRGYWLYLPQDYVAADEAGRRARHWPLVVSFHGMKPFDNARPQALEWEAEADRYGFIVIAPELHAPDVLAQFPVRTRHPAFVEDEAASVAIIDHVVETTGADRSNVLSTSWSSGGYMAHYMLNQHPDKFTCLAVRQSNFSESVLDSNATSRSLYHPILVINTENDFGICRDESKHACEWYQNHGYKNWGWVIVRGLGHERTPDVAAYFFAQVASVTPKTPSEVLAKRQAIDGSAEGLAVLAGTVAKMRNHPTGEAAALANARPTPVSAPKPANTTPRDYRETSARPADTARGTFVDGAIVRAPAKTAEPATSAPPAAPRPTPPTNPQVGIRVSSAIGVEPLHLGFSADCPADWQRTATFIWTLDGNPLCSGLSGQKTLADAGEHTLGLLVVTSGGTEYRASRVVRVLPQRTPITGAMLEHATP